jgi:transcriptional regulator with XRE-family HTH domain
MGDWQQIVGSNIRKLRIAKGLSQERLAFAAEIDLTYMGGIERGNRNPSLLVLVRIADALGCKPADLLQKSGSQRRKGHGAL